MGTWIWIISFLVQWIVDSYVQPCPVVRTAQLEVCRWSRDSVVHSTPFFVKCDDDFR